MSLYENQTFTAQEDDSSDMLEPSDMMGEDSLTNQASAGGMAKGSPTRSLVMLWFGAVIAKWVLAWLFRGNIKG